MPRLYLNDAEEVKKTEPTPISPDTDFPPRLATAGTPRDRRKNGLERWWILRR